MILPLSTRFLIAQGEQAEIWCQSLRTFQANLMIPHAGTMGGASDWIVHDCTLDGVPFWGRDLSGKLFGWEAEERPSRTVVIRAGQTVKVHVSYTGEQSAGAQFLGAMTGPYIDYQPDSRPHRGPVIAQRGAVLSEHFGPGYVAG